MERITNWLAENIKWVFSGVGVAILSLLVKIIKDIISKKKKKKSQINSSTDTSVQIKNGSISVDSNDNENIRVDYAAEQNVSFVNNITDPKKEEKSLFSKRYKVLQYLLNEARGYTEKEYTTEYISYLLGLSNVSELKIYLNGSEEPNDSFKKQFVEVFGVNEEWIMFNRGEYPFAPNETFFGDDPMDILRNHSLKDIEYFILVIGEIEKKKHVLIVKKFSDFHYEVISKPFIFYSEVGKHGQSMLVSLYRFVREASKINKLFALSFSANEKEFMDILNGGVCAKKAVRLPVITNFESNLLDLDDEKNNFNNEFIEIKKIIRDRISEIDNINQSIDEEKIYKNLGKDKVIENDIDSYSDSTPFFAYRFGKAFPGVRGAKIFDNPKEAVDRLEILLKYPLSSSDLPDPIWWFRGYSNLHITKFHRVSEDKFLMNSDEIKVKRVIAYNASSYYKSFVYVETISEPQTGLYGVLSPEELKERADEHEIYTEEYAVVGDKKITRAEYDDGAAVINGKPVDISEKAELRVRYVTPYNFIICAHFNPINNPSFDSIMKDAMNKLLSNDIEFSALSGLVEKMPRNRVDI